MKRLVIFTLTNLVWFIAWFSLYFILDEDFKSNPIHWNFWTVSLATIAQVAGAYWIGKWLSIRISTQSAISFNHFGYSATLVVNAMIAFVTYAIVRIFIYGL